MLVNVVVQLLFVLERVTLHVLVQVDPAEVARSARDEGNAVLGKEVLGDGPSLPHALTQSLDVVLDVLLVVQHVGDHRLAHRGNLAEMRQLGEATLHVPVASPKERNSESREAEVLRHAPQHRHVVGLGVVLDDLRVAHERVVLGRAELLRLHRQGVDLVGEQMQVVLAAPSQHHAQLLLRVDVSRGVGGIRDHQHLHVMALRLGLLERLLQNLLRDLVVVGGDVRLVHHTSVAKRHVSSELHITRSDHDVGIARIKDSRPQNIHRRTRPRKNSDLILMDRSSADFFGHEISESLTHILTTSTTDGVHVVCFVQRAELGILGLELIPHVNVFSTRNVHHTVRMLRTPGVL